MVLNEHEARIESFNQMLASVALTQTIAEVRIPPSFYELTRTVSQEYCDNRSEEGGFFGGIVRDGVFYIFDRHLRGMGCNGAVQFNFDIRPIDVERMERIIREFHPDYRTVIYHNHPRVTEELLREEMGRRAIPIVERIRRDLKGGIYEPLGIKTLDDAINEEFSRVLSEDDIRNTSGRYNLLLSPTSSPINPFGHINFYDLAERSLAPVITRIIPVKMCEDEDVSEGVKRLHGIGQKMFEERFGVKRVEDLSEEGHVRYFNLMHGVECFY